MSSFIHNIRGFFLIETLIIGAITSIIILGTLQLSRLSTKSVQVSSVVLAEQEIIQLVRKGLTSSADCKFNLDFNNLVGSLAMQKDGRGSVSKLKKDDGDGLYYTSPGVEDLGDIILLEEGQIFKNSLEIVKIEMDGRDPLNISTSIPVERYFTVYYKKLNLGKLNTLGGGVCDTSDMSGCYFQSYKIIYDLDLIGLSPGTLTTTTCNFSYCTRGICCYKVDELDEILPIIDPAALVKGRSLIGCRGPSDIPKSQSVALGFRAGSSLTAGVPNLTYTWDPDATSYSNIFIGYGAGQYHTTGYENIFIGFNIGRSSPLLPDTGYSNISIGAYAGDRNTTGNQNIFLGFNSGKKNTEGKKNIFIGIQAGYKNTTGEENTFIGSSAGENVGVMIGGATPPIIKGNVFLGKLSGIGVTGYNNTGEYNTFIGPSSGKKNTEGSYNIYIGYSKAGPYGFAGFSRIDSQQMNIGNLILGRIPDPSSPNLLQGSPDIPAFATPGVVINGDLKVRGSIEYCINSTSAACSGGMSILSSKVYKKNIKSFKDYERALDDIINTPLFTYEYKKDRPEKSRMGIISEELPEHLQLKGKGRHPRENGDPESKGRAPSMPDWPTISGTFWASIKVIFTQFQNLKNNLFAEIKKIKKQFIDIAKIVKRNKEILSSLKEPVQSAVQVSKVNQEENLRQKKEFIQIESLIKKTQEKLKKNRREIKRLKTVALKEVQ